MAEGSDGLVTRSTSMMIDFDASCLVFESFWFFNVDFACEIIQLTAEDKV